MRIAQIAPLYESVPPKLYGGTERVVSYLTEELVRQGHDVTLYASGDSVTEARLVSVRPTAMRLDQSRPDHLLYHMLLLERVFGEAEEFDVLHFHVDYLHFPLSRRNSQPNLTTLHGRLDLPDLVPLYREFPEVPLVSISDAQRKPLPWVNWQGTVYHALPPDLYQYHPQPGQYLAFLGRVSPEKGLDQAVEIAKRAGIELQIAAKVDPVDEEYFHQAIEPLLDHPLVRFIGEISDAEKDGFLGNALALLMPIHWEEPFGLVAIEAMACGTPVIAYGRGSIPEIIDDGDSGIIVGGMDEAVEGLKGIRLLSREQCRRTFERRFTVSRMADDYVAIYHRLLEGRASAKPLAAGGTVWTTMSST